MVLPLLIDPVAVIKSGKTMPYEEFVKTMAK